MLRSLEKESRILARTYYDRLDVYRNRLVKDPDTGESSMEERLVYSDAPCAFSMSSKNAAERGTIADEQSNENVIFADPGLQMNPNDRAVIRTASGQVYEGRTGRTFVIGSHGETNLKVESFV